MEERVLGRTGLKVKALGFGGMELGNLNLESADRLLNAVLDQGINYIDTCPEYTMSEYFIGMTISHRRSEFILATKCGDNMTGIGPKYLFDKKTMLSNLDDSLRQLKTDYIDVWQLHGVVPEYFESGENDELLDVMREVKKSGKVRFLGLTVRNGGDHQYGYPATYGYNSVMRFSKWRDIDVIQLVYGGLTRMSENAISVAAKDGVGIVARGLVKKYDNLYDARFEASNLEELFQPGETRNEFLLRYALTHPDISVLLIGTKNYEHVQENVGYIGKGKLSADVYEEAKRRLNYAGIVAGPASAR